MPKPKQKKKDYKKLLEREKEIWEYVDDYMPRGSFFSQDNVMNALCGLYAHKEIGQHMKRNLDAIHDRHTDEAKRRIR